MPLLAQVARGRPGRGKSLAAAVALGALLAGGVAVAIAGLALGSSVGEDCGFCREASCVQIKTWWQCVPAGQTSNGCRFSSGANGTALVECPLVRGGRASSAAMPLQAAAAPGQLPGLQLLLACAVSKSGASG